jgi:hypothetical protein
MEHSDLDPDTREFATLFCDALEAAVENKLHSFFLYGAALFPHPPRWRLDFDFHAIVAEPLTSREVARVHNFRAELAQWHALGRDLDGYTLLLGDAQESELPRCQVLGAIDESWALHRAHIHAGRFHLVFGADPRSFVPIPTWSEIVEGLDCEMRFIVENPQHPQFGILNLARLLYSWTTRDVVLSKYQAAEWALANVPERFHPAIAAAVRDYAQTPDRGDRALMDRTLPAFLTFVQAGLANLRTA